MNVPENEFEDILSESGKPCLTIILPTHRLAPARIRDKDIMKVVVNQAKDLLKLHFPFYALVLEEKLREQVEKIDWLHTKDGVGIYISPHISKIVNFSFRVKEKIKAGESFEIRDLLYHIYTKINYAVLSITKEHIRLFAASGEELTELRNEDFPLDYKEMYEYSKPARGNSFGNSLKEFEKDKSVIQTARLKDLLRIADQTLGKHIDSSFPIVVTGGKKEIADYMLVSHNTKRIIGKVSGNYNFDGDTELAGLAWIEVQNYLKTKNETLLSNFKELVGKEMIVAGLEAVWKAANIGNAFQLVVEKDFEGHAYIIDSKLKLKKPVDEKEYLFVGDAVEEVIRIVFNKGGKVAFVDNGKLKDFDGIALQLHYK